MFERFVNLVRSLFGRRPVQRDAALEAQKREAEYRRIDGLNFAAIFAGKLSRIAMSDATMDVSGPETARTALVRDALGSVFAKINKITAQALGSGGRVLVPYVTGGSLRCDVVAQDRVYITGMDGDRITAASFLADSAEVEKFTYYRWTDYALENGGQMIRTRITDEAGRAASFEAVEAWAGLPKEMFIPGAEQLTFAYLRSPIDSRQEKEVYGVPVTYGCDAEILEIKDHLKLIAREYKLTRPMLGLSSWLWKNGVNGAGPQIDKVRATAQDSDDPFIPVDGGDDERAPWMIYAPAIRDGAMYNRLDRLCEQLEKAVGVSRGILTPRETASATATEIRAANHDTYVMVSDIRKAVEHCMGELLYAFDLLAEAFGLAPAGGRGEIGISFDWDMSLFESSSETFQQMSELESRGGVDIAELRQWVKGGTLNDAKAAVAEIAAKRAQSDPLLMALRDEE